MTAMQRSVWVAIAVIAGGTLFLLGGMVGRSTATLDPAGPPHVEFVTSSDGSTAYQCVIAASGIWCEHWADRE